MICEILGQLTTVMVETIEWDVELKFVDDKTHKFGMSFRGAPEKSEASRLPAKNTRIAGCRSCVS
jgi:hypothetical protein